MYKAINLLAKDYNSKSPRKINCYNEFSTITYLFKNGEYNVNEIIDKHLSTEEHFDFFISHSHEDMELALEISNFLKKFGIKCFIDSMYWDCVYDVLRDIDSKHCVSKYNKNGEIDTFNYKKRNATTAAVYSILTTQLSKAMDKSDCIIFINTENSLLKTNDLRSSTYSPWLYHEISMTSLLQKKIPWYMLSKMGDSRDTSISSEDFLAEDQVVAKFRFDLSSEIRNMPSIHCKEFFDFFQKLGVPSNRRKTMRYFFETIDNSKI
ncbi:MAG: toll/interleukin-1 receptor domain-containing protein [Bombella sp.]|nr:toll/interleukin-1 receptor domain-containing protein [Bombella sp.]